MAAGFIHVLFRAESQWGEGEGVLGEMFKYDCATSGALEVTQYLIHYIILS